MLLRSQTAILVGVLILSAALISCSRSATILEHVIPRTADGKPDLSGDLAGPQPCRRRSRRSRRAFRPAGRQRRRAGRTDSLSAMGGEEEDREREESPDRRSAGEVLPAGRAAHHVHGVPVPDLPDARPHRDDVRVVAGASHDLHERRAGSGRHRLLDGRLARPLGRRHARRGRQGSQRPHLVRPWRATFTARHCTSSSATR